MCDTCRTHVQTRRHAWAASAGEVQQAEISYIEVAEQAYSIRVEATVLIWY